MPSCPVDEKNVEYNHISGAAEMNGSSTTLFAAERALSMFMSFLSDPKVSYNVSLY